MIGKYTGLLEHNYKGSVLEAAVVRIVMVISIHLKLFFGIDRVIFHQCEVLSINRKNGDRDVYLEGLCKRSTQKPFAVTTLPPEKGLNKKKICFGNFLFLIGV